MRLSKTLTRSLERVVLSRGLNLTEAYRASERFYKRVLLHTLTCWLKRECMCLLYVSLGKAFIEQA